MFHLTESQALDMVFLAACAAIVAWFVRDMLIVKRRKRLLKEELPADYIAIIERNVPLYNKLPEELKKELRRLTNLFLDEKCFEGCGGLVITDEIRVTIAAQACMLLLNRKTNYYPKLKFILVYPSAYVASSATPVGGVGIVDEQQARLGESWMRGSMALAWDHVKMEARDIRDGHNVVLHEFAHQLDQEDGASNGTPILEQRSSYLAWSRVFAKEYDVLCHEVSVHMKDVIDSYGATNPAEFFAVVTETFFEKPKQLNKAHPGLYEQLTKYYKLDPLQWQKK